MQGRLILRLKTLCVEIICFNLLLSYIKLNLKEYNIINLSFFTCKYIRFMITEHKFNAVVNIYKEHSISLIYIRVNCFNII